MRRSLEGDPRFPSSFGSPGDQAQRAKNGSDGGQTGILYSVSEDRPQVRKATFDPRLVRIAVTESRLVRSFCTALKPPASPTAARLPGGHAASGRSRPPPRLTASTARLPARLQPAVTSFLDPS
jgi:hypothetical protein